MESLTGGIIITVARMLSALLDSSVARAPVVVLTGSINMTARGEPGDPSVMGDTPVAVIGWAKLSFQDLVQTVTDISMSTLTLISDHLSWSQWQSGALWKVAFLRSFTSYPHKQTNRPISIVCRRLPSLLWSWSLMNGCLEVGLYWQKGAWGTLDFQDKMNAFWIFR